MGDWTHQIVSRWEKNVESRKLKVEKMRITAERGGVKVEMPQNDKNTG